MKKIILACAILICYSMNPKSCSAYSTTYQCQTDKDCVKLIGVGVFCVPNQDGPGSSCVLW